MATRLRSAIALSFLASLYLVSGSSSSELQIVNAERRVDLTSHIVRTYLTLKVENIGDSPASEILLCFSPEQADHLAVVKAAAVSGKKKKTSYLPLEVKLANRPDGPNGAKYYSISLVKSLSKGESVSIEVLYVLTHSLSPFPVEISQSDSQLVYFHDSAIILSPYLIKQQVTFIKTPSNKIESFTSMDPTDHAGAQIKYGPYAERPPYSYFPIIVHFENNNAFAVVEELVREIEISHWGSIQITEHYTLKHAGARHKGVFSRVDYQSRPSHSGVSSFKNLLAELPPRVHSVYYRDNIGNISSSRLRTSAKKSELLIEPRYPLFGGWKATFVIGYVVPLNDFLYESANGDRYLNYSFGSPLAETVVDKLTIKVVLPEGSKNPSAVVPFPIEQRFEKKYSYLDVAGRTVVVLEKKNVVPEHNVPFLVISDIHFLQSKYPVYYQFSPIFMLAEPLMLTGAFLLFFLTFVTYLQMDLSLCKIKNT